MVLILIHLIIKLIVFTSRKSEVINEGYPLESIQFIKDLNKFKSELTENEEKKIVDLEQKDIFEFILNTASSIEQNQLLNK